MLKISVSIDMSKFLDRYEAARDQVPFATALALTRTGQAVKSALRQGMSDSFSSVTTYTKNSLYLDTATKAKLTATIGIKGQDAGAVKWLRPEIYGGPRQRGIEVILAKANLPPSGLYAVPGKFAKLKGGKVDLDWLNTLVGGILVQGRSGGTMYSGKRRNVRRGGAAQYFVLTERNGKLLPGIYGVRGRSVFPYIIFVRQPQYRARFDFYAIAERTARERFPEEFAKAVKKAMDTRR